MLHRADFILKLWDRHFNEEKRLRANVMVSMFFHQME